MKAKTSSRPLIGMLFGVFIFVGGIAAVAANTGTSARVTQYKIAAQIWRSGVLVANPLIVVNADSPANISMESEDTGDHLKMDIVASKYSSAVVGESIQLKMSVDSLKDGQRVRAHPRVAVAPGEEATVSLSDASGEVVLMKLLVTEL